MMSRMCSKCGREVPGYNNALELELLITQSDTGLLIADSKHLFPVFEEGNMICEGSPSRARYFPGQKKDERPGASPYDESLEEPYLNAYLKLLQKYPPPAIIPSPVLV